MKKDPFECFCMITVAVLGFFAVLFTGMQLEQKRMRAEAVAAGHAEYYLDDKHERRWRWKDSVKP